MNRSIWNDDHALGDDLSIRKPRLLAAGAIVLNVVAVGCSARMSAPGATASRQPDLVRIAKSLDISPASWTAQGPSPGAALPPVDNVTKPDVFKYEVGGAVHFLLVDPTNTATVYAGAASGGVFKADGSTGTGVDSASVLAGNRVHWVATTDSMPSLSIEAMAIDPANHLHIVAGTWQVSNFGAHGVQGLIYFTNDGGATWTAVTQTPMRGSPITGLAVNGTFVLATVASFPPNGDPPTGNVFVSNDGGLSWNSRIGLHPTDSNDIPAVIGPAWDVAADPTNPSRYYVIVAGKRDKNTGVVAPGSGVYLGTGLLSPSTTSWTRISANDTATPDAAGLPHALAASGASGGKLTVASNGRLYAGAWALGHRVYLGFTADQGQHWTRMETPRFPKSAGTAGKVGIKQVTRDAGSAVIVVETAAEPDFHGDDVRNGNARCRIALVSGFDGANGDWRLGPFIDPGSTSPSTTKFTLQDRFSGADGDGTSGNGDGGQEVGRDGTFQLWDDTNTNGQSSNLALAVDPTSPDLVYLAGDHDSGFAGTGDTGQAANIVRGDATNTQLGQIPTAQWTFITGNQTATTTTPHGDIRHLAFNGKGELLLSSDGGICLHPNPRDTTKSFDWVNLNGDLNSMEMHDLAFDPLAKTLLGSTQDNGVPEQSAPGATTPWTVVLQPDGRGANGDGGDVAALVQSSDPTKTLRISSGPNLGGAMLRQFQSSGGVVTQISSTFLPFNVAATDASPPTDIYHADSLQFTTPLVVNPRNTNRLVVAANNNVWESTDLGQSVAIVPEGPGGGHGFAYGHPSDEDALWVAGPIGPYFRLNAGDPFTKVPAYPGNTAWAVVMSPSSPKSAYVTSDQHVYVTPDATATAVSWTDLTGDLLTVGNGDGPGQLRSIVYVQSPTTGDRIVVGAADATTSPGSEVGAPGVFMMAIANPGVWTRIGANLPNASAYDLVYDAVNDQLYVATAGRGAWSVSGITHLDRAPIARCRDVTVAADGTCHATVTASAVDNGSSDPDGGTVTLTLNTSGPFGPGANPVTLKVTDSQGASATCSATVTVVDQTPPVIGTAANLNRTLCEPDAEPLTLTPPAASDNCGAPTVTGAVTASSDPRFPIPTPITGGQVTLGVGTFTVTWTASDGPNHTSSTQTITIRGGVYATLSADMRDRAHVRQTSGGPAALLNSGTGMTHLGIQAQSGDVLSRGAIRLDDRSVVTTIARSAGSISLGNQVVVGTVLPNAPLTFPAPFSVTPGSFGTTGVTLQPGQTRTLAPGSYGSVVVNSRARLNLQSGVYRFAGFDLEPQATVALAQASGPIQIQVQSSLIWRGVETLASGSIAGFTLAYFGSAATSLEAPFTGVLVAPNAQATLGTDTSVTFAGQFYVRALVATPDTVIVCREDLLP